MSQPGLVAQLLSKLNVSPEDAKKAVDMLTDTDISKSASMMPHAMELTASQIIESLWEEGQLHRVPGPDELKIGPPQEASGGGAEKMTKEYSNPAPQMGIQLSAEKLAHEFHHLYGAMKSLGEAHNKLANIVGKTNEHVSNITTVAAAMLAKAEEHEKEKDKEEEDDKDGHSDKACSWLKKSRKLLKKAKAIKAEAKTAEGDNAKALKSTAKLYRKAAARALLKAQTEALAGRSPTIDRTYETRKAITEFISSNPTLKADMEEMRHEKEEKDEEKKAKKSYQAIKAGQDTSAKAVEGHGDAKGNQSDKQDPATGNQDDSAVKAIAAQMQEKLVQVDNALKGVGLLKTDLQGMFDVIMGKTTTQQIGETNVVPMIKSIADDGIEAIAKRIDEADEAGSLDPGVIMKARSLLTRLDGVIKGSIHKGVYETELNSSPAAVREFFAA